MTPNNNEHDATKTNNKESIDVTYVENKEHERAQETPAESEQIVKKMEIKWEMTFRRRVLM